MSLTCACADGVRNFTFETCDDPVHQYWMPYVEAKVKEAMQQVVRRSVIKLCRQIIDDELVLSESELHER